MSHHDLTGTGPSDRATLTVHPAHLPIGQDSEGCIELLADRLREWPGVLAIEANFHLGTLAVRYEPLTVSPDQLNAFADEVGAMFAQRVTVCEKRETLEACSECALRFGRLSSEDQSKFHAVATPGSVRLSRRDADGDGVEVVRPLAAAKPWGAALTHEEEEHHAEGRAMAVLAGVCLATLLAGMVLERVIAPENPWSHALYYAAAISGGWFATRSTFEALRRFKFDVNLLMILSAVGAAAIGYIFEAAVLMFLFSLSNTLEVYTMGRTRHALRALLKLRPARALVRREGREIEVEL